MPRYLKEAVLYEKLPGGNTRCLACRRRCVAAPGGAGACGVRRNLDGRLFAPWGFVSGFAFDPVEKKPFFHALPGARTLSYGMLGCNYKCDFCQNWEISTARDPEGEVYSVTPAELAARATDAGARIVVSTYNEPVITAEWSAAVFKEARSRGLRTGFVSNGYATPEAVSLLEPVLDLWKVDLKSFDADRFGKACGADLAQALAGFELIAASGFWVEAVTLLVPGFNDSEAEISAMAAFLAGLSRDIPWHVTAFHPAYRRAGAPAQTAGVLLRAREIGLAKGLNFVYCGNIPDEGGTADTRCPACKSLLVSRSGFTVLSDSLGGKGACSCGRVIPGVWN